MRWLSSNGLLAPGDTLDYGCGHGQDAARFGLDSWDPHWNPWKIGKHRWSVITCIYVLNVLGPLELERTVWKVRSLLKKGGSAYFAVRRDLGVPSKKGRNGITQRTVHFNHDQAELVYEKKGAFAIYWMGRLGR